MLRRLYYYDRHYGIFGKLFRSHSRTITRIKELELSNLPSEKTELISVQSHVRNGVEKESSPSEPTTASSGRSESYEVTHNKEAFGSTTTVPSPTLPVTTPSIPEKPIYREETAYITGIPPEQARRTVRIYPSAKTAMQSGTFGTRFWKLRFEPQETWENPLMGWTASADPHQATQLEFNTKEDAIRFAEKNGWKCSVSEPQRPISRPKSYSSNFRYEPRKLRLIQTK